MKIKSGTIALALVCLALTGCATSRSEIKLNTPVVASTTSTTGSKGAVFIRTISDKRSFEQAPSDPSIPSLGFEGAAQASDALKGRAIGRKRNTYGKALGDVLLEDGQTVTSVVRENLVAAFTDAGYKVETDAMAASLPTVIDVEIRKFWSWFQPGFWAITLSADIQADLKLAGAAKPNTIDVHVEDKRQTATDGAWMVIMQQALNDFRRQVAAQGVKSADAVAQQSSPRQ